MVSVQIQVPEIFLYNFNGKVPAENINISPTFLKKNGSTPASFSFIFGLFRQTSLQLLQQIHVKNVHPVYGVGI